MASSMMFSLRSRFLTKKILQLNCTNLIVCKDWRSI